MPSNFYRRFRRETCDTEDCSKIAKFWANSRSMAISEKTLTTFNNDSVLLKKVITGDESWMYGHDIETNDQLSQWKRPEASKTEKSPSSSMKCKGFAFYFLRLQWHSASWILTTRSYGRKEYYFEVRSRLRKTIWQNCTELWKNQSWIWHHDNAPAHTSMLVCEFLAKHKTVIMPQPSYSLDLVPADFILFPKLQTPIKLKHFAAIVEIKDKSN